MRSKLTTIILISMVLGILVGWACHELWPDPKTAKSISDYISIFTDIFLRLIKMIIAPLVFSTLVVGVAHMGDTKSVGRIGAKAMVWFIGASLVSLLIGLIMVNILRPGDNLNLPLPDADASTNLKVALAVAQGVHRPSRAPLAPSRRWPPTRSCRSSCSRCSSASPAAALGDKAPRPSCRVSRSCRTSS